MFRVSICLGLGLAALGTAAMADPMTDRMEARKQTCYQSEDRAMQMCSRYPSGNAECEQRAHDRRKECVARIDSQMQQMNQGNSMKSKYGY